MEAYRCPHCQALSYPGLMGFPRCHRCHEQLRQCRYCLHQRGGLCQVEAAGRPRLQHEDGKPWCQAFASALADETPRTPLQGLSGPARLAALAPVAVVLLGILLTVVLRGRPAPPQIETDNAMVRLVDGKAVASFSIDAANSGDRFATVRIDRSALRFYSLEPPDPDPVGTGEASDGRPEYRFQLDRHHRLRLSIGLVPLGQPPETTAFKLTLVDDNGEEVSAAQALILGPPEE
jgi:hypothetical protein